jgi:succinate dehydrogenase flavin-adding protein (antitoxin of CptAB toxin-antitoxin module)
MDMDEQIQSFSDHLLRCSDAEVFALARNHENAEHYEFAEVARAEMKRRAIVPPPFPIRPS